MDCMAAKLKRMSALLTLLLGALLAGAVPAAATELGADLVFKLSEAPAFANAIGDQAADDDKRDDGTDSPDPDAIRSDQATGTRAAAGDSARTPTSASGFVAPAALLYRARAPPAS